MFGFALDRGVSTEALAFGSEHGLEVTAPLQGALRRERRAEHAAHGDAGKTEDGHRDDRLEQREPIAPCAQVHLTHPPSWTTTVRPADAAPIVK